MARKNNFISSKGYTYSRATRKVEKRQKSKRKYNKMFNWEVLFNPDANNSKPWHVYGKKKR